MLWNHNFSSRPFPYDISTVNLESGRNLDIRGSEGTNTNGDAINEAETSNDNQRNKDFNLKSNDHEIRYPLKIGSFQLYVHGFGTSDDALERLKTIEDIEIHRQFQLELERMIVLDYVIGNSDRTLNNWLVHISFNSNHSSFSINTANSPDAYENKSGKNGQFLVSINENKMNDEKSVDQYEVLTGERASIFTGQDENRIDSRRLKIACIDNGLAFPVRHPKKKEILPFTTTHSWSVLPQAQIPFSEGLKSRLLPILSDPMVWEVLVSRLRPIFLIDQDFCERTFKNQMSVMRGQLYNLVLSLRSDESPIQLLNREPLTVTGPEDPIFGPRNTF